MKLFNVRSTKGEEFGVFNEDGVKGTHDILEEGFGGVKDLHGACRKGGRVVCLRGEE